MVHEVQSHCRKPGKLGRNKTRNGCTQLYNFNSKQSKIFLILLVTNCIVSLPMDLSLLKSHVGPDLSRQCSLVLTRWPRHYAFKDHWSEANLMIIFCPISAGNWLVSIRLTRSDQSEASVEILGANQRPSPNLANKQRDENASPADVTRGDGQCNSSLHPPHSVYEKNPDQVTLHYGKIRRTRQKFIF